MPNEWIEKLKRFNADGGVWAIPKRNTDERKMLDRGQRFKYSLLKERFPDLSRQLEEEVSSREAKAKMRKAEELIKQAEAIDNVVKKRKLRKAPEEQPPSLESAEAPIRPENKKRETEEQKTKTKTDAVAGKIKDSIYNKMEAMKTIEGPKTATEYYYYVSNDEYGMPLKALKQYADEQGMTKKERMSFFNNITRTKKRDEDKPGDIEKDEKTNQEQYDLWLKGIDWRYDIDKDNGPYFVYDTKEQREKKAIDYANRNKKMRDESILEYRKKAEEEEENKKKEEENKKKEELKRQIAFSKTYIDQEEYEDEKHKAKLEERIKGLEKQLEELENKPKKRKLRKSTEE